MRLYTCDEGITVRARNAKSAENKMCKEYHNCAVSNVRIDEEAEEYASLPDCPCGWSGKGTGPSGQFVRGDRCPKCGESL